MRVVNLDINAPKRRITALSYGASRSGKCVTGDTRILSPDGRYERIDEIVKWGKYQTLSLAESGEGPVRATTPSKFHDMGYSKVFEVRLADGRTLRGTPEHPVLTVNGYVPMARLTENDEVVVVDDLPFFGSVTPPDWMPELLAYMIADGNLTQGSPTITKKDDAKRATIAALIKQAGDEVNERFDLKSQKAPRLDVTGGNVKQMLADFGLWGRGSADKFVPDDVFTWHKNALKKFLNVLVSCDGFLAVTPIEQRKDPNIQLGYSSASPALIQQVAHLMRRFGFRSRARYVKGMLNGVEHGGFSLTVSGLADIARYISDIGIDKPNAAEIGEQCVERASKVVGRNLDRGALEGGLRCERVVACEAAGEAHVYDLTVDGLHNFLANDIVVHNTRFAGTWPRPLFLSDNSEGGWETLRNMDREAWYEPDVSPKVWAMEKAEDMGQAIATIDKICRGESQTVAGTTYKAGDIQTIVIDSLTFYADSYLTALERSGAKDMRQIYQRLGQHLREVMVRVHELPVNVVWICLEKAPDEDNPSTGGVLVAGQTRDKAPARCDYWLYHRSFTRNPQFGPEYEVRTKKFGPWPAGGRDEGALPDPLSRQAEDGTLTTDCTYRAVAEALGIIGSSAGKYTAEEMAAKEQEENGTNEAATPAPPAPPTQQRVPNRGASTPPANGGPAAAGPTRRVITTPGRQTPR